jgi:hypothetical protein
MLLLPPDLSNKKPSENRKVQTINKPPEMGVCFILPKGEMRMNVEYKYHRSIEK